MVDAEDIALIEWIAGGTLCAGLLYYLARAFHLARIRRGYIERPFGTSRGLGPLLKEIYGDIQIQWTKKGAHAGRTKDVPGAPWGPYLKSRKLARLSIVRRIGKTGWQGARFLEDCYTVDTHFFEACLFLIRSRIESFADLRKPFQWLNPTEGKDAPVNGYDKEFAERILEQQLGQFHHRVLFPVQAHPDTDRVEVDGKPFLVKDLLRFDHQDHFEKYPGTGVITSEDFFASEDAQFAIDPSPASSRLAVLTGVGIARAITNDQAHAQVAEASPVHADSVSSAGNVDYPNPFLTLGLSTMREIRLLKRRHTDLKTAAKNIGLDVAGTGVGSFAGAKAGATIGTAVAPGVGSVVGAIIGGISGAIAGRSITNKIKLAEADAARAHYAKTMREFQERLENVTTKAREALEEVIKKEQTALSQTGTKRLKELDALAKRLQDANRLALILSGADIRKLFAKRDGDLRSQENQLEALRMRLTIWERTIWPSGQSVHLRRDRETIRAHRAEVFELGKALLEATCPLSESEKTGLCLELFASFGGYDQEIRNRISLYRSTLEESLRTLVAWPHASVRELAERRATGLRRIGEKTETLRRQTGEQLKIDVKRAKRAQGRFARELRKLGLLP